MAVGIQFAVKHHPMHAIAEMIAARRIKHSQK